MCNKTKFTVEVSAFLLSVQRDLKYNDSHFDKILVLPP